jgi:hypothetical protein
MASRQQQSWPQLADYASMTTREHLGERLGGVGFCLRLVVARFRFQLLQFVPHSQGGVLLLQRYDKCGPFNFGKRNGSQRDSVTGVVGKRGTQTCN